MKKVYALMFISVACLAFAFALPTIALVKAEPWLSPLDRLEQRTRQIPALHTLSYTTTDDKFAFQAARLQTIVENVLGVQVNYTEMDDPELAGWTLLNPKEPRAVNVDATLHWTARFEVLAHEAGHRFQPPVFPPTSSESEVFAQAVSFLVCRAYGHDTLEASANYLAVHKGGLHVLHDYLTEINYAVVVLSGGL